eukprot:TRINITY_DN2190_c0_g2_i13.p1 TRINITY_DN2190_c0_g2~~TRINITY_DN2190_c0_g2_i13.p1  ORF type:complete len:106 (-),score=6.26 TRINITY_DN2190_c0_g2_i13:105-422(-)
MQHPAVIKVVMVGLVGAGKTSIIKRYCYSTYSDNCKATVGADFATKILHFGRNEPPVQLNIWDIAGMQRYCKQVPTELLHFFRTGKIWFKYSCLLQICTRGNNCF